MRIDPNVADTKCIALAIAKVDREYIKPSLEHDLESDAQQPCDQRASKTVDTNRTLFLLTRPLNA